MTRRIGRLSGLIAAGVAIVGTGGGVMAASYSAFSNATSNASNSWTTGSVAIGTDSAGSAMFSGSNLQMGDTGSKCIKVSTTGSLPTTVRMYGSLQSDQNLLSQHLRLKVYIGTAASTGGFANCSGFTATGAAIFDNTLNNFTSTYTNYATGLPTTWSAVGGGDSRVFQFVWSFDGTTPMSSTTQGTFTWEAQGS